MNIHSKIDLGRYGEDYTCRYLQSKGYKILARNFRCYRVGEIDIIAKKDDIISFIEVKTRTNLRYGMPIESVTLAKQRKIHRCAEYYLQSVGIINQCPVLSFDVVEITLESTAEIKLRHIPHCF